MATVTFQNNARDAKRLSLKGEAWVPVKEAAAEFDNLSPRSMYDYLKRYKIRCRVYSPRRIFVCLNDVLRVKRKIEALRNF